MDELVALEDGEIQKTMGGVREQRSKWISPPLCAVKGNCDGVISTENRRCAAAAISRKEDGVFMGASVQVLDRISNSACVEVMAFLLQDQSIGAVVIPPDCASVVRSIEEGSRGKNSMVIEEIRSPKIAVGDVSF